MDISQAKKILDNVSNDHNNNNELAINEDQRLVDDNNDDELSTNVDQRLGNCFDLSKASRSSLDTDNPNVPMFKNFRLTYASDEDKIPETIRVQKGNTANLLQRVVNKFSDYKLYFKKIELTYPVRKHAAAGCISGETWKVKWNPDENELKEALDTLYLYAEPDCHLIVKDIRNRPSNARKIKPSEQLFNQFKEVKVGITRESYQILMEDENIIDMYFQKLRLVQIMLNSADAINLLNPGRFLCPFVDCQGKKPLLLRCFNNLSSMEDHLLKHEVKDKHPQTAEVLLNRYHCLTKTDFLHKTQDMSILEASAKLDVTQYDGGDTSSLKLSRLFLPTAENRFRGRHLHMKISVLESILMHDNDPLAGVPGIQPANSFFNKKRSSSSCSGNKTSQGEGSASSSTSSASSKTKEASIGGAKSSNEEVKKSKKSKVKSSKMKVSSSSNKTSQGEGSAAKKSTGVAAKPAKVKSSKMKVTDFVISSPYVPKRIGLDDSDSDL